MITTTDLEHVPGRRTRRGSPASRSPTARCCEEVPADESRRRSPRPLGLALDRVRDDLAPATLLAEVQRVVAGGRRGGDRCRGQPTAERGGVLTVSCSASVWAQELDLMGPAILERLNGSLEGGSVTRLRCVALPAEQGR